MGLGGPSVGETGKMTTILVVDDSAVDRRLVGGLLQKDGDWQMEFANNGAEALARMKQGAPDLVITDLQMPDMDGLELVAATRVHYPDIPVILITAYGSETLAVEALEQGAASYVPKSKLAEKLSSTAKEVLALAYADRSYHQLIGCLAKTEFAFHLDNDAGVIDALVHLVQQMVEGMGFSDFSGRLQIGVALKEALTNALYHGNLEIGTSTSEQSDARPTTVELSDLAQRRRREPPYRDRKIHVDVKLTRDEVRCVVRDQGPGFDPASIPDVSDPNALAPESGRGLSLMRTFMDEVTYNEPGNEVTMTKRRANNNGAADVTGS